MQPEALSSRRTAVAWLAPIPEVWRGPLARLIVVWCGLILAFLPDWHDMARQWWDISTYNHVLLVPAIIGWLVWQRAAQLRELAPCTWWPALLLFAAAVFLWVLGEFAGFNLARHAAVVAMLVSSALAILGLKVAVGLAFPLAYMALLVPFGDELVPPLQMITAFLTIGLVQLSGIPAVIDGVLIDTPAGLFQVAEACSGVKFLIAMIAFGLLVANVCFVSWRRRMIFMVFCLAVPILANGVRAWGTIQVAQYVGAEAATGFDHIVYGWVFFAAVIAIVLICAWRFFDRGVDDQMIDPTAINASPPLSRIEQFTIGSPALLAVLAATAITGKVWAYAADTLEAELPAKIALPAVTGWQRVDYAPTVWWEPRAGGAQHRLLGRYRDARGHTVDVFFALYGAQRDGAEAGGFGEGALPPHADWAWQSPGPTVASAKSDRLIAKGYHQRLAETYYRTGDVLSGSNSRLKLEVMADRLLLRDRPTVMLILSAEEGGGQDAAAAIAAFRRSTGSLAMWMDHVAGIR
ncbi:MAG: exosortase A [Novosphingobium sp.]